MADRFDRGDRWGLRTDPDPDADTYSDANYDPDPDADHPNTDSTIDSNAFGHPEWYTHDANTNTVADSECDSVAIDACD
jgi:hypothetical protein